jgi:magnesium-transporting ATPase (P-type)
MISGLKATQSKLPPAKQEEINKRIANLEKKADEIKKRAQKGGVTSVRILHRHHFSSQLQRMSVVCRVNGVSAQAGTCCLVKGSPEAILKLLRPNTAPEWYQNVYREMAEKGMRVLALAMKRTDLDDHQIIDK